MDLNQILSQSDSPLNIICSSIVDAVVIADTKRNFVYWNDSAKRILSAGPADVDPKVWAEHFKLYYIDSDIPLRYEDLPMVKALNGETYSEYKLMTKNELHPNGIIVSVNGKPIIHQGVLVGALTTFRDVTTEYRLQNQIDKERAFFQSVLDLLPSLVCIKNLDGKFIYANKSLREFVHMTLVGKGLDDFLPFYSSEAIKQNEESVLETGSVQEFEETIHWEGKKWIFMATRFPFRDSNGAIIGTCGVLKDMTRELNSKLELEQERNKTAHISKLAAIGILAAEIAHEIKNPLTIMRTNNDVIRYALREDEIDRSFLEMKMNTQDDTIDRMDKVASSLGMLSKDASRECPVKFKLGELLDDVSSLISFRTRKMGIAIEIDSECAKTTIEANRVQISEVLLNLVVNALDAVEGTAKPSISISCKNLAEYVEIRVFDNGPGVEKEIVQKIFEPFFTTKDISRGTGLGLSISKKIMMQHQGDLYYEANDSGHCFVVCLPYTKSVLSKTIHN